MGDSEKKNAAESVKDPNEEDEETAEQTEDEKTKKKKEVSKDDSEESGPSKIIDQIMPESDDEEKAVEASVLAGKLQIIKKIREWFGLPKLKKVPPQNELEKQIQWSMEKLITILQDCNEAVSNVRVATLKSESERLREEKQKRAQLLIELDEDQKSAFKKYKKINAEWSAIGKLNDPLDIHNATNLQRDKCIALLEKKDRVIQRMKDIIKRTDNTFLDELLKQEDDINILVDRIDHQLKVVNDAYRKELALIEVITTEEKEKSLRTNRKRWELILQEKNALETAMVQERYKLIDDHEKKLDEVIIEAQESLRRTKIEYLEQIREVNIKVEEMRGICELNSQKMKYNYQLLLERDEENRASRANLQLKLINLQKQLIQVKAKALSENKNSSEQIQKLKDEIEFYATSIFDIDKKTDNLGQAACKKYFQLWDFNQKVADELIEKTISIEKLFYEQVLSVPWKDPLFKSYEKESIPSYVNAKRVLADLVKEDPVRKKRVEMFRKAAQQKLPPEDLERRKKILQVVFEKLGKNSNFLQDPKLEVLMEGISQDHKSLIKIDQMFVSLGINNIEDMIFFTRYLMPYLHCHFCDFKFSRDDYPIIVEEITRYRQDLSDLESLAEEQAILTDVNRASVSRFQTSCDIIYQEFCVSRTEQLKGKQSDDSLSTVDRQEIGKRAGIKGFDFTNDMMLNPDEIDEKVKMFGLHQFIERKFPYEFKDKNEICQKLNLKKVPKPDVEATDENLISCKNRNHIPVMPAIYVVRAIRDFMVDYYDLKKEVRQSTAENIMTKRRITLSRLIDNSEVELFWKKYANFFSHEQQEKWETFEKAMKNYTTDLRKRHKLNEDIKKIKRTNAELRLLLQRYLEPRRNVSAFESIVEKVDEAIADNIGNDKSGYGKLLNALKGMSEIADQNVGS